MNGGGDVLVTLAWGLRRYAWLVVLSTVAFALLVPAILQRAPDRFEAEAQVGPTGEIKLPNLDALPRLGTSVFSNGAVADAVRESVVPPLPRSTAVVPERVELIAAQDNIVFTVVGRGDTPEAAQNLANVAAVAFTQELNEYSASAGSFAVGQLAAEPAEPVAKISGPVTTGIGALAGLAGGMGVLVLLLIWRRPVLDPGTAEEITRTPVLGRVRLARSQGRLEGIPRLARRIRSSAVGELLLAGPRNTRRARRILPRALSPVLGVPTRVVDAEQDQFDRRVAGEMLGGEPAGLLIVVGASQAQVTTRPDGALTLLAVKEGISAAALRRQSERYLDDGNCAVILVRGPGWSLRPRRGESRWPVPTASALSGADSSDDRPVVRYARD